MEDSGAKQCVALLNTAVFTKRQTNIHHRFVGVRGGFLMCERVIDFDDFKIVLDGR